MNNLNKKIILLIGIIIAIVFIRALGYNIYIKNKTIAEFNAYLDNYKQETSTYDLTDNTEEYENLGKECEQAIANKDYKSIENLKSKANQFKENLLNKNIEITNAKITELENIDISNLNDKDSILSKIEEIKTLKNENQFIKANNLSITLKNDINNKLEIIKQENDKKLEEQQRNNNTNNVKLLTPSEVIKLTTDQLGKENQGKTWEFTQYIRIMRHIETKEIYYVLYINFNANRYHYLINAMTKQPDDMSLKYKYNYSENDFEVMSWNTNPYINTN